MRDGDGTFPDVEHANARPTSESHFVGIQRD